MFFRTPRFIRRFIRRHMHPMAEEYAYTKREKLSMLYMFLAWNAGGFVIYKMCSGRLHWPDAHGIDLSENRSKPAYEWAKMLGVKKAEVYRIGSGSVGKAYEIDLTSEDTKAEGVKSSDTDMKLQ